MQRLLLKISQPNYLVVFARNDVGGFSLLYCFACYMD